MERNLFPQQVFSASQRNSRRNRFFLAFFHDQCLTRSQWLFEFMDKKVRLLFLKSFWLKMANQSRLNDMFCSVDQNHTVTYSIWLRHSERSWTYPSPHPTPPPLCLVVSTTWPWWNGPPAPNWPSTGWTELRTSPSSRCVKQQPESAPRWEQRVKLRVSQSLQWAGGCGRRGEEGRGATSGPWDWSSICSSIHPDVVPSPSVMKPLYSLRRSWWTTGTLMVSNEGSLKSFEDPWQYGNLNFVSFFSETWGWKWRMVAQTGGNLHLCLLSLNDSFHKLFITLGFFLWQTPVCFSRMKNLFFPKTVWGSSLHGPFLKEAEESSTTSPCPSPR